MKGTIAKNYFVDSLRRCTLGGTHGGNPTLSLVALTATKSSEEGVPDSLTFRATNGLVAVDTIAPARIAEPGAVALNCKLLANAVSVMPDGDISLDQKGERVTVTRGARRWSAALQDPENVKAVPEPEAALWLSINAEGLLAAMDRVEYMIKDVDKEKRHLEGIFVDARGGVVATVVIGGHGFVVQESKVAHESKEPWEALLPAHMLSLVREACSEAGKGNVDLYIDKTYVYAQSQSMLVTSVRAMHEFPPWRTGKERLAYQKLCSVPRLALLDSLKACLITVEKAFMGILVRVEAEYMHLDHQGELGNFDDTVPISEVARTGLSFKINPEFLKLAASAANSDFELGFTDDGRQIILTTDGGYYACICLIT